jgi:hypothetical protein
MPNDQPKGKADLNDQIINFEARESAVLNRLCEACPLSLPELVREFGELAEDLIGRLTRRGLVNRLDGEYLIPSAAGRHANALDETWQ